ncbi:MAG: aromatic ring-hydroxylating dioxygenase subunit alpha [Dehalococcoidia bacterium]|nr:aromatic ring-hydroxylating dioxygenase subunit alpha [Dehalococcoidia bacterium]
MLNTQDNEMLCRVSASTPMGEFLRRFWTPILLSSELPEPDCDPVEVRLFGEDLVAFRDTGGNVGLLTAFCPHRRAPLFYGRNEEHGIRCVYHGWKFDVHGHCVEMPTEPAESSFQDKVRARSYPIQEWGSVIWAYLGPPDKKPELPHLEWGFVADRQRNIVKYNQECNFVQALEGDIDSTHAPFLHGALAGAPDLPVLERLRMARQAGADTSIYQRAAERDFYAAEVPPRWNLAYTDYGVAGANARTAGPGSQYWRVNLFLLPFYTYFPASPIDTRGHTHMWIPEDDEHTRVWCIMWAPHEDLTPEERDSVLGTSRPHIGTLDPATGRLRATKANHFLIDRKLQRTTSYSGIMGIREQDTAVVEGMGAIADRTQEHLGTSDALIIAMRRSLLNNAKALVRGREPKAATHGGVYRVRAWAGVLPEDVNIFEGADPVGKMTAKIPAGAQPPAGR